MKGDSQADYNIINEIENGTKNSFRVFGKEGGTSCVTHLSDHLLLLAAQEHLASVGSQVWLLHFGSPVDGKLAAPAEQLFLGKYFARI